MPHKFIGYRSLLSHNSLSKTIPDRNFTPIIVKEFKRIFNLIDGDKGDVLNLEKNKDSYFNAVMFEVNDEELTKLKEREEDYNLEEVTVYDFSSKKDLGKALVSIDYLVSIDKKKKKPEESYLNSCRESAYKISEEFGKVWDETTFTSTGKKITDWLKSNKTPDNKPTP